MLSDQGSHQRASPSSQEFHYNHSRMPRCICTANWLNLLFLCSLPALLPLLLLCSTFDVSFLSPHFYIFISLPPLPFFMFSAIFHVFSVPLFTPCVLSQFLSSPPSHPFRKMPHSFHCLSFHHIFYVPLCSSPLSPPPAKPKNSANAVTVQAGTKSVVVAQCEAVDGKPAATINWLASGGGNHSTSTTNGPDGTVTVRSDYRLVPTPADNSREVTCVVDQRTQDRSWVRHVKLSVECKEHKHTHLHLIIILFILHITSHNASTAGYSLSPAAPSLLMGITQIDD